MSQAPAIEVRDITVIYNEGTANEVVALDSVSFSVLKGEKLIITGSNGSGKSTLLKAIAGTVPIKSGAILIDGKYVTNLHAHRRARDIGFVHQDPMLGTCPNLTVHENFQLAGAKPWWSPFSYPLKLSNEQVDFLTRTGLQLAEKATTPVNMLSGGQRQAMALCLALTHRHPILFLDEFTSALDEKTEETVLLFALSEIKKIGSTVVLIMHDINKACQFAFRRLEMTDGQCIDKPSLL